MLREEEKNEIRTRLREMKEPVTLVYFTQLLAGACQFCVDTERLLKEVESLTEKITLEVRNFVGDADEAARYAVDKIPALCLIGGTDQGLRFYGMPSGYEFMTFLDVLLRLSARDSGLSVESKKALQTLNHPVHLQVFVTPTCPHCPGAASLGYRLAMQSENIRCDVVEISEFPYLSQKYGVMSVPRIVVNDTWSLNGAVSEMVLVEEILKNVENAPKSE
jgi:glutaredoxin-like protein